MIPAISMPRRDGRSSFEKLKEYLAFEPRTGTKGERVERGPMVPSDNLLSLDTAAQEMRAAASRNYLVQHPVMHFQLSWKPGEVPTEAQWLYAAKRSIKALGFDEHQYLIAAHDDKEHFHVHVMLNRVHPETAKAHNPRLTQLTLHRVARELEHEFGWAETEGLFRWDRERNEAVRNTRFEMDAIREKREQTPGKELEVKARQDHFRDQPSLKAFASKAPAETLRKLLEKSTNWQQAHLALGRHGLTIHKAEKGGYTVGVEGSDVRVKASDVFRFAFSGREARARTERQLGEYEPMRLGRAYDPPVVDYSRAISPAAAQRNAQAFRLNYVSRSGMRWVQHQVPLTGAIRTIDELPKISDLRSIPSVEVDRISIEEIAPGTPGFRSKVHLVVRPGTQQQTETSTTLKRPQIDSSELRRQPCDREEQANKQRRQQRTEERARERLELKREFEAAKLSERAVLHEHTISAKARRLELVECSKRDKLEIRSSDAPWQVKKAMRSVAEMELLQARHKLNSELATDRSGLSRTSFQQWVEERAKSGDQRAVAQVRGWRYQDSRNLRRIDKRNGDVTGELHSHIVAGRIAAVEWQELANEPLRQLKEDAAFRDAVRGMAWKADSGTGDVIYRVGGVNALIDRGKKIVVLAPDKNSTRVALQMAIHKYGSVIKASGTAEWQAELIQAVVQDNVQVSFTDSKLQERLVEAREQDRQQTRAGTTDFEEAKQRFRRYSLELAERYGPGLDPTRADRLITERMTRVGIPQAEISGALRELSLWGKATASAVDDAYCQMIVGGSIRQLVREGQHSRAVDESRAR